MADTHNTSKLIMVIAGENSGDLLGADVVRDLKKKFPDARFVGVAGKQMQAEGVESLFPMDELNIMGFVDVLPHLRHLFKRRDELIAYAKEHGVDLLLTIDAPDFSLRVAQKMKQEVAIPCVHYVSPSVWAWRKGRAQKMAQYLDHVLALFPFEVPFYEKVGLDCSFVGHPIVKRLAEHVPQSDVMPTGTPKIALLPGSRKGVMSRMLPTMMETFALLKADMPDLKAVIPLADSHHQAWVEELIDDTSDIEFIENEQRFSELKGCRVALATSGTSNLELAMLGIPTVVAYKLGGLTYAIARLLVHIPYASPVNWVAGQKVIPEMIQSEFTAAKAAEFVKPLFNEGKIRTTQLQQLKRVRQLLENGSGSNLSYRKASDVVASYIS